MEIREIIDKGVWESFCVGISQKSFLQSWNWGEFNKAMGSKIWRLGVFEENKLLLVVLVIKVEAKRGKFLLVPHGPLLRNGIFSFQFSSQRRENKLCLFSIFNQFSNHNFQTIKILFDRIREIAREERVGFIRFNSIWERSEENEKIFKELGCREASIHTHPEASWVLNITPSEEELLSQMRRTTRYLIKQGEKDNNLKIFSNTSQQEIKIFSDFHKNNSERKHFVPFSVSYLENEFSVFNQDNQVVLFRAEIGGEIVAMAFVLYWSGIGFYHHAVLLPEYRKTPAAYRLLWEVIKEAKKRGCVLFDFWGYAEPQSKHPWAGPTLFKMGFGGEKKEYVKTKDLVVSPSYWVNFLIETIRKKKRGF